MESPAGVSDLWNGGGNICEPNGVTKFKLKQKVMQCVSARQGLSSYRLDHRADTLLSMCVTVQTSTDLAAILLLSLQRNARLFVSKLGLPVGGIDMNWDQAAGNRKQFTGQVKEQWGDLTDDKLDQIAGKRDILVGKIQAKYGIAKEEAEKQVKEWEKLHS